MIRNQNGDGERITERQRFEQAEKVTKIVLDQRAESTGERERSQFP